MKKFSFVSVVTTGLAALLIGLAAPVQAAPSGDGDAQQTISELRAEGYNVIITQVGNKPLSQASVVAIRPGTTFERFDYGVAGADHPVRTVTNRTVYVDIQ